MKIERYEKGFLVLGAVLLALCMGALVYASVGMGIHLPGRVGTLDPTQVETTPPFDAPGLRQTGPGTYEAVIVARAWQFEPREIRVPVGSEVTFTVTSADVIHGLSLEGTRVNMMIIPGQIARNSYRFEERGEHLMLCHEFCGVNHHTMFGKVIVE
ncbi:MAG: cytochrome c oxidase subunit II [Thermoanaerobaculia bacterium]